MSKTIGNPLTWVTQRLGDSSQFMGESGRALGSVDRDPIVIRQLVARDVTDALRKGAQDFMSLRTDVIAIVLMYPIIGIMLVWFALDRTLLPLVFPIVAGFALIGPVAAIGLYEMSRLLERRENVSWADALRVMGSPSFAPIATLGAYLAAVYIVWLIVAVTIYNVTIGPEAPSSIGALLQTVLTTSAGWTLLIVGVGVGLVSAVVVLAISVVSFPLLLDRPVGLSVAVVTSVKVARQNPGVVALWGIAVVALLGIGILTFFIGLIVTLPILGHATWHLYRKAIAEHSSPLA